MKDIPGKIINVVVPGAPKCATTHLARFFDTSDNFGVLTSPRVDAPLEAYSYMFNATRRAWTYKFAKTPGWIYDRERLDKLVGFLEQRRRYTLVLVSIREYNMMLKSLYSMRIHEPQFPYKDISFDEFKATKSAENPWWTYEKCVLSLKEQILYLISITEKIDNIKLVVVDQLQWKNNSTLEIFEGLGVDVRHEAYQYEPPKIKTELEYDESGTLHREYLSLIGDKRIQKYMLEGFEKDLGHFDI